MKPQGLKIAGLDGLAKSADLRVGDRIIRANGRLIDDELDFRFYTYDETVTLDIQRPLEKSRHQVFLNQKELAGLAFDPMHSRQCRNRCLFCFIDQLPAGMRSPLYVKDEDYRFSFLYGNYVTLTSVTEKDLARICRFRLSPMYISVHATEPAVRNLLLGRKTSADILKIIKQLSAAGISIHTQVVLCPGINDGEILKKTVSDLACFYPSVASIAIVPVGLTRFRRANNLTPLKPVTKAGAKKIIISINTLQNKFKVKYDDNIVYLADEFYWKAEQPFPLSSEYGDFSQWENGVGMIPLFTRQWKNRKKPKAKRTPYRGPRLIAITGELSYPYLAPYIQWLRDAWAVPLSLIAVKNHFFGRQVKVTGLITGRDVIRQCRAWQKSNTVLLIPEVMLNEDRFLDDITPDEVGKVLNITVRKFQPDPAGFEKAVKAFWKDKVDN